MGGENVLPGHILVRQRGSKFHPGLNVNMSKDHTLHSLVEGVVAFSTVVVPARRKKRERTLVNVIPHDDRLKKDMVVEGTAAIQKQLIDSYKYRMWRKHYIDRMGTGRGRYQDRPTVVEQKLPKLSGTNLEVV